MSIESKKKKILVLIIKNKNLSYKNLLIKKIFLKFLIRKKMKRNFQKQEKVKKVR